MLKLDKVISVYSDEFKREKNNYVEIHDIKYTSGKQYLEAGRPLSEIELKDIFKVIDKDQTDRPYFLPENVLLWHVDSATSSYTCVFWIKAQVNTISFSGGKTFNVPWPPMVVKVEPNRFKIFALKANRRPSPETMLYHIPAYNRYGGGSVCLGSYSFPEKASPSEAIHCAKEFWFNTSFSHSGDSIFGGLNVRKFWEELEGKQKYPKKIMEPACRLENI